MEPPSCDRASSGKAKCNKESQSRYSRLIDLHCWLLVRGFRGGRQMYGGGGTRAKVCEKSNFVAKKSQPHQKHVHSNFVTRVSIPYPDPIQPREECCSTQWLMRARRSGNQSTLLHTCATAPQIRKFNTSLPPWTEMEILLKRREAASRHYSGVVKLSSTEELNCVENSQVFSLGI